VSEKASFPLDGEVRMMIRKIPGRKEASVRALREASILSGYSPSKIAAWIAMIAGVRHVQRNESPLHLHLFWSSELSWLRSEEHQADKRRVLKVIEK
jgi:hypothetical protein